MKIQMLISLAGIRHCFVKGDVVERSDDEGERLIAAGYARRAPDDAEITAMELSDDAPNAKAEHEPGDEEQHEAGGEGQGKGEAAPPAETPPAPPAAPAKAKPAAKARASAKPQA